MKRSRSLGLAVLLSVPACAAPPASPPRVPEVVTAPRVIAPPEAPPEAPPRLSREEARARAEKLRTSWRDVQYSDAAARAAWRTEHEIDEPQIRALLSPMVAPCLAQRERDHEACKALQFGGADEPPVEALLSIAGDAADPRPASALARTSIMRLLLALDARGVWRAGAALTRVLERRMAASLGACQPPGAAEIAAAKSSLADFAIVSPDRSGQLAARWPSASELDEIAYFHAVVADSGPEVGAAVEDHKAPPLPADHPDLARRAALREEVSAALFDGDAGRHLRAAEAYLRTLGFPDPLRLGEEGGARWGGAAASFTMRDAARSAEIVGRYDLAEALYRRAAPGGGMCGTSVESRRAGQIEGVIRAAEQIRGCRAIAAERLHAVARDRERVYGPERLARAGFDVARAYAGALHTLGRDDGAALERALSALPTRSGDAVARLLRLGPEPWATRLRAIRGYADSAQGAAIPRLLDLMDRRQERRTAMESIGLLAEDHGFDPCFPTRFGIGWGHGYGGREVRNVMMTCATRIAPRTIAATVTRVSALSRDPEPATREQVARLLGRLGAASGRPTLHALARDRHQEGQICTARDGQKDLCEPSFPVARAAREALEMLKAADTMRARQRAEKRR